MVQEQILALSRAEMNLLICTTFYEWWVEKPEPGVVKFWTPDRKDWTPYERSFWPGSVPTDYCTSLVNQLDFIKTLEAKHSLFVSVDTHNKDVCVFNANGTKAATLYFDSIEEIPLKVCQAGLIAHYS